MVVAVVLSVPLAARADGEKSLKVGANEEYKTIQAAINYINEQESKTDWTIEVEAGTYDRFVVLSGLDNLTVKAAENADVTVNTLDGSKPEDVTFNSGNWMDLGGVQLWDADGVTLENLTFDIKSTSGLTHHMRAAISNHNEAGVYADNFVIRGCLFIGNGDMSGQGNGNVGISISKFSSFSIENCSFSNLMEGIRGQSDGANVDQVTISNNSFTNCSFAIHEYAGDSDRDDAEAGKGTYTFSNNTVTGTTNLYNKAYFEDLYVDDDKVESDGYTINVSGNTLTNAIIGLVNLETDGGATDDVLAGNTMSDNSFVVTGSKVSGQIEMHSNYAAPEDGYGHWVWTGKEDAVGGGNPDDAAEKIQAAIDKANEEGSHTLSFGVDDSENFLLTFTWFKDMIYWVTDKEPVEPALPEWETSKSKTATNLDENFESEVTLSLPSAEEELVTDIVFVLDESSCTEPVKTEASRMLKNLYQRAESEGATIKIGAVQFRGEVTQFPLTVLSEDTKGKLADFMSKRPETGGSNMSMGLIAGKAMLDGDKEVDASRKYLILVGDGITYTWDDETTKVPENYGVNFANGDAPNTPMLAGPDGWDVKYGPGDVPTDWNTWLTSAKSLLNKTIVDKSSEYDRNNPTDNKPYVAYAERGEYLSTVDIALYKSYQVYSEIAKSYKVFVVDEGVESEMASFPFGPSFMQFMAGGKTFDFGQIEKEIYYLLDKGSEVVDVIGHGMDNDNNAYDFDFVNEIDRLTLTVGGNKLNKELIADPQMTDPNVTSAYGFFSGDESNEQYDFELYYYENGLDGQTDECFVWKINVPVSNFAPVQLTYAVKLTNPQPDEGVYGQYDEDGSESYTGLYTNHEATLYPVDSNGHEGRPELFPKPTVSYSVGEATIAPVDITIYKGGDEGYEGVVDSNGVTLEANESLPEPGFYLQLPDWINAQLANVRDADKTENGLINLSDYVTITATTTDGEYRSWKLHPYGDSHPKSYASGGYIYRIEPAAGGTDELRLQFKDENGVRVDDNFTPATALKNEYTMSVFGEGIETDSIKLHINVTAENTTNNTPINIDCGLGADTGKLTIRYVSGSQNAVTTDVVSNDELDDALVKNPGKAVATVPDGTTFYINESHVDLDDVERPSPSLLFDQIVDAVDTGSSTSDGYATQLEQGAIKLVDADLENPQAESRYLDLVDVNNGNVWLTADNPVTVYWPRPENSTETTKFYLVHFDGLDREMDTDKVSDLIQQALRNTDGTTDAPRAYEIKQVDNLGDTIRFTTKTFSPFVLVWGTKSTGPGPSQQYGNLTVEKTVTGDLADKSDEFSFTVTLSGSSIPSGEKTYGDVTFNDGKATFTLKDGQSVSIKGVPSGTRYTVEETDAKGYDSSSTGATGTIAANSTKTASFVNDKSTPDEPETLDPTDPVNPGGSKVLLDADGNPVALSGGEFTFKLTGLDGAPMPAGAVDGSITVTNRADGVFVFGDIVFDEAGTYTYELTEVAGTDEGITYDGSTHTLVVVVSDEDADGDGKLDIASLTYDGESTLPTFTNETTSDEPPAPDSDQPGTDEPAEPTTPGVPDTGDHTVSALPAVLALGGVALVGGALAVARRRVR